jgi:hypothetical protein
MISSGVHDTKNGLYSFNKLNINSGGWLVCYIFLAGLNFGLPLTGNAQQLPKPETSKPVHYYGHDAVIDRYGVIAPWYLKPNGQCDYRIRIAAETLKRYPWTSLKNAVVAAPDYLFTSNWEISAEGIITPKDYGDWSNGDLGQRSTSVLKGMVDYYRYSGDPAAIAHITYMGDYLLGYCLTPAGHSWPGFPISVPTKGKAYGNADPNGMIQLDISAGMGEGLLRAYQLTKNPRWFEAAKHWGDLFAEKCNMDPTCSPWPRYAVPVGYRYKDDPRSNIQTGGVTMILSFLDELIRLGYTGNNQQIITARDAGIRYLRDKLLPDWTQDGTWGFFFWDWLNETQNCSTTADVAGYLIRHKERFPNWRNDARNILTLFLNRSGADPKSGGDVYSGAWAYPESSSCCGRSLWYAPLMVGSVMAQYGVVAEDSLMRELGYRQMILQTYDVHENGVSEDNIDGGVLVNSGWLNIAHPWPLLWVQQAIGWLPEELGASRENHIVRTNAVIDSVVYGNGTITYSTFNAPAETEDVLRLSFVPTKITADGAKLSLRKNLSRNGFTVKKLPNGDAIVTIRHDGRKKITVSGQDPQQTLNNSSLQYSGVWTSEKDVASFSGVLRFADSKDASVTAVFKGNQVRVIGRADQFGGLADIFIDGVKQSVFIDFWNPFSRGQQSVYYKNGLEPGEHTLKIIARGTSNPYALGSRINVDAIHFSSEDAVCNFPSGTGPTGSQRLIFGYTKRQDYKDSQGHLWKPATEVISRLAPKDDVVAKCWMNETNSVISGTPDPELYRFGYHAIDFWANITVGPGKYSVRLKFAATQNVNHPKNSFEILINEKTVLSNFNVLESAKEINKAIDLVFNDIIPLNGIIKIRFKGLPFLKDNIVENGEAFVQAIEVFND